VRALEIWGVTLAIDKAQQWLREEKVNKKEKKRKENYQASSGVGEVPRPHL